ncbi:MAG: lysophospholipid acyltransferase family protein [Pirellulales bacterium]|nr:lysophospholipid acyltransferase family protein [Pirellulales bacterium]
MSFRPVDFLVYLCIRTIVCVLQAISIDAWAAVARPLAWILSDVLRVRRRVVLENLTQAFPEYSDAQRRLLARAMWEHLLLLVGEVALLPRKVHDINWREFLTLSNHRALTHILLSRRPVIIVTGHFGNFEAAGYLLGILGFTSHTVARKLDNPYLDRFVNTFRRRTGQKIVAKKGGYEELIAAIDAGGAVSLLADQHAGQKGCWVDFFGRPASAHKAIALLALEHEAPVAVASTRRLDRPMRFCMRLEGLADPTRGDAHLAGVQELTQWYTRHIETMIRREPGQYWWLHRRWKPRVKRGKAAAADKQAA